LKDKLENTSLQFKQIPAFSDNYLWVIIQNFQAWVVDPGDANPIMSFFEQENIVLKGILITHHHLDHIGGAEQLLEWAKKSNQPPVTAIGPLHSGITFLDRVIEDQDEVELFPLVIARVLAVPGHTLSHAAYFLPQTIFNPSPRLYCGDTLFATGCGRLFEGSAQDMYQSLQKFAQLPNETLVCCAHEYTLSNIKFALSVEEKNPDLLAWSKQAAELRHNHLPTVPTSIGLEKRVNPFMRCDLPSMIEIARQASQGSVSSPSEVLAVLRKMKDSFK
jgi:hydroxyacylglutathione hydrolase